MIQVSGYLRTETGTYGFSLINDPQTYDTFGIAVGDSVSDGVPGSGAGNIEVAGSVDAYGFAGTAGQALSLNRNGTPLNSSPLPLPESAPGLTTNGFQWGG